MGNISEHLPSYISQKTDHNTGNSSVRVLLRATGLRMNIEGLSLSEKTRESTTTTPRNNNIIG